MKIKADRLDPDEILRECDSNRKTACLQALAQESRLDVLDILHDKQTGHWGGASSCAELLAALYFDFLRVDPRQPKWPQRDRLVISKGHASCMIYTMLAKRGFFTLDEVRHDFRQLGTRMQGHPCMNKTPGVEMSTGALGHGPSVAVGMALAAQVQGTGAWSLVLLGDGCLNEGETWEGIMTAAKFRPPRMAILVDYNKVQLDGPASSIMPLDPLQAKFRAFNCNVADRTFDGHHIADIQDSFAWLRSQTDWPAVIVYETHKGHGVSFTSDNHKWHGPPIDDASYARARPELLATLDALKGLL